jgi:putative transposase
MGRRNRCVLPGVPCHITQRGVNRRETFSCDDDRETYLGLLQENLGDAEVSLLSWCLMVNHVHLIALPRREDSLSVLLRRVHGRYAQYYNARIRRTGHLWQNRFFGCVLGPDHLWPALRYVERNPVRAGIVARAADYQWSSAAAHLAGHDDRGLLDMDWWGNQAPADWGRILEDSEAESEARLRRCTYAGRPFGDEDFVAAMAERFGRHWVRGRPKKKRATAGAAAGNDEQFKLF